MEQEKPKTTFEFLADEVYLPGYMALTTENYDKKGAIFDFRVKEPPVTIDVPQYRYFTPRGLHICVSQAGYALAEQIVREGKVEGIDIPTLRQTMLAGRIKVTELYQKFRKAIRLGKPIQGRFNLRKARLGKIPILKLDFGFENDAVTGYLTSVIARHPVPQTNVDIMRAK